MCLTADQNGQCNDCKEVLNCLSYLMLLFDDHSSVSSNLMIYAGISSLQIQV